ncbi:hypothetical protein [Candidatus Palauibacter sp.]|uniref:hypothetical protein n=1 Tax=Candidatus Palauibacter sp. TaxID=3101350 RepID=UPI003AF2AA48
MPHPASQPDCLFERRGRKLSLDDLRVAAPVIVIHGPASEEPGAVIQEATRP